MKANISIIKLLGILLLASCKSIDPGNEIRTEKVFTLCDSAEAKLSLIIECSFRGEEQRPFIFNFPEEIDKFDVPKGLPLEACVSPVSYFDFDPPTGRGEGLVAANLSNVLVFISILDPVTTNRVKQEIQIPWLNTSSATNNDFWHCHPIA